MANTKNSILKKDFHFRYDLIFTLLLTVIAPFCVFVHLFPLGDFWQTFICCASILSCSIIILGKNTFINKTLPVSPFAYALIVFFIALTLIALLQNNSMTNRLIFACYAGTAILTIVLTQQLAAKNPKQYYNYLAFIITIGGIIESIGAIAIQYRLWGIDYWMTPMSNRLFGFIAQSNHFATYIMIAFLSLTYLTLTALDQKSEPLKKSIRAVITKFFIITTFTILSILFGFALFGSGSRTVILYLIAIIAISIFCIIVSKDKRYFILIPGFIGLIIGSLIFFYLPTIIQWFSFEHLPLVEAATSSFTRTTASDSFRLSEISKAISLFSESPLLGIGTGNYASKAFWFSVENPKYVTLGYLTLNCHNFIVQILVEFGIAGLLSFIAVFIYTIFCFWKAPKDIRWWFTLCVLSTFFIIAMLEYILWRVEFIVLLLLILAPSLTLNAQQKLPIPRVLSFFITLILITIFYIAVPSSLNAYAKSFFYSQSAIMAYPQDYATFKESTKNPLWGRYILMSEFKNTNINFNEIAYLERITDEALQWQPHDAVLIKKLQLAVFTNNTMNLSKYTKAVQQMYPTAIPGLCKYFSTDMQLSQPQALRMVRKDFNCRALSR